VFRTAARAQRRTGVAITAHCQRTGRLGPEQVDLLFEEGVAPDRIVSGHHGGKRHVDHELKLLERGVYVQIDHVGVRDLQPDEQRAQRQGHHRRGLRRPAADLPGRVRPQHLEWFGGYGYPLTRFAPMLRAVGVAQTDIDRLLVENPARVFAIRSPTSAPR